MKLFEKLLIRAKADRTESIRMEANSSINKIISHLIVMEQNSSKSKRKYVKKPKPLKETEKPIEPIHKPTNKTIIVKFGF